MTITIQSSAYKDAQLALSANADRLIIAFTTGVVGSGTLPTNVQWNGNAMTKIVDSPAGIYSAINAWYYKVPNAVSAGNYAVSGTGIGRRHQLELLGVDLDNIVVDSDGAIKTATTDDGIVTPALDVLENGLVLESVVINTGVSFSVAAGQTQLYKDTYNYGVSKKEIAANGTTTMGWSWTNSRGAMVAVSLRPYIAVTSDVKKLAGVEYASIKKASGIEVASISKISGVS